MISRVFLASLLSAFVLSTTPSLADDSGKTPSALPGVQQPPPRVVAVPEPDQADPADSKTIKAGKWEVTVSGYVWVQIGAGSSGN